MDYVVEPMIGNEVCSDKKETPTKLRVIFDSEPNLETFKMSLSTIVATASECSDVRHFSNPNWSTGYFFDWNNNQKATYITPGDRVVRYNGQHASGKLGC